MRNLFIRRGLASRSGAREVLSALQRLPRRWRISALALLLLAAAALLFQSRYTLGLNTSPSLPHTLYLIHKDAPVTRGDFVAFRWQYRSADGPLGPYPDGTPFVKQVAGLPGDTVTEINRAFFVNGMATGRAKTHRQNGTPLERGPSGVIPPGQYYVTAPHPDSLDSRYRLTGWISQSQIIGRAYVLF